MERIKGLIARLQEQNEQGATPAQLLITAQLLQSELVQLAGRSGQLGTAKVAVTMPVNFHLQAPATGNETVIPEKKAEPVPPIVEQPRMQEQPAVAESGYFLRKPALVREETTVQKAEPAPPKEQPAPQPAPQPSPQFFAAFETPAEAPTLAQYTPPKEIHELITENKESLNDRLKQEKTEVVHTLKDTPIKDLRKGIGINDRFTFVNELFRGDEAMYERSIKTINSFHILSEAEYWINRELKFKLGWNDSKDVVQHFYGLVRRRFS